MMKAKKLLFLDDIRNPVEVYHYTQQDIFLDENWHIVRDYKQFVNRILRKGLPEIVSFDHDLGYEDLDESDSCKHYGKTGYDCARWLIDYCMDRGLEVWNYLYSIVIP